MALLDSASNPALDAADPADAPPFDQRGLPRDATPDIGAFELEVQPPPNTLPPLAEKVPLPDSEIVGAPLFLVGPSGDAEISFVDEYAAFQSSLGVYSGRAGRHDRGHCMGVRADRAQRAERRSV